MPEQDLNSQCNLVVIGTDCLSSYKSNYHTNMTSPKRGRAEGKGLRNKSYILHVLFLYLNIKECLSQILKY